MKVPTRYSTPVFLTLAVMLVVAGFWLVSRPREPVYQGKTLTEWLYNNDPDFIWMSNDCYGHIHNDLWDELGRGGYVARGTATNQPAPTNINQQLDPAVVATRQMGTNAIPRLLELMASRPTAVERIRESLASKLQLKVSRFICPYHTLSPAERRRIAAFHGFAALGTNALPALPALSNLLQRPGPDFALGYAISAIGTDGISVLVNALTNSNKDAITVAAFSLGMEYPPVTSAAPALLSVLERGQASYQVFGALGRIGGDSTIVVPALTKYLGNTNAHSGSWGEPDMAILILGLHGEKARSAVPAIVKLYQDAEPTTRQVIRVVVKKLDPENVERLLGRPPSDKDDEDPYWNGARP